MKASLFAMVANRSCLAEPLTSEPATLAEADLFSPDGGELLYSTYSMATNDAAL